MKLEIAIAHLNAILRQKPDCDFDFVFREGGYGLEVKEILWDSEKNRTVIVVTDQDDE